MRQATIPTEDPEKVEQALNVSVVALALLMLVRGVSVHAGFAVFMAVAVPVLLRLSLGLLIKDEFGTEGYVDFDGA